MSERFFSHEPIIGDRTTLDGPEAHHLLHVMRAAVGDAVTLFDGKGCEFQATIESLRRTEVDMRITARHEINRELTFPLVIGVALPKGDRQKWLVEKLTELGVTTLVPLITERSVAQPAENALERLRRTVIEATKQCGRNVLMDISEPRKWDDWIEQSAIRNPKSELESRRRLFAHPDGLPLSAVDVTQQIPTQLAIGPEGGLSDDEVATALAAGWQKVSLGPRILRVETAAIALAAAISSTSVDRS